MSENNPIEQAATPTSEKKPGWFGRNKAWILCGAGGLVLGVLIGTAGAGGGGVEAATPAPTKTVTVEVEKEVAVDDGCRAVAEALHGLLLRQTMDVVVPLSEGGAAGIDAFLAGDASAIEAATEKIVGANDSLNSITADYQRIDADYRTCVQG